MKRQITTLLLTVFTALTFCAGANAADAIGSGSVRVTVSSEDAIGLRYTTEDNQVQTEVKPSEVLHLSTFDINGQILLPSQNSFTMVKNGNNLVIGVLGEQDEKLTRLNFDNEGLQEELLLPSDIEFGIANPTKVEILDENDQVVAEITDESKEYTSVNGMAIRFAIEAQLVPDEDDGNDPEGQEDLGVDPNPASGGCSMVSASGGSQFGSLILAAGLALTAARRLRIKK